MWHMMYTQCRTLPLVWDCENEFMFSWFLFCGLSLVLLWDHPSVFNTFAAWESTRQHTHTDNPRPLFALFHRNLSPSCTHQICLVCFVINITCVWMAGFEVWSSHKCLPALLTYSPTSIFTFTEDRWNVSSLAAHTSWNNTMWQQTLLVL